MAFSEHSVPKDVQTRPAEVSRPLRKIQDIDAYATGVHTLGHIRTYRDGVEVRSIGVIDLDKRKIFRVYDSKKRGVAIETGAAVYSITEAHGIKILSTSVNGATLEAVGTMSVNAVRPHCE